jgi:hypothetical protein
MIRLGLIVAISLFAIGLPALADPIAISPPIPTGAPLEGIAPPLPSGDMLPAVDTKPTLPWWLEGSDPGIVAPANFEDRLDGSVHPRPWHPNPPPAAYAGSACNFNLNCGDDIFSPDFRSYQVLVGAYASSSLGPTINSFDYIPITFRAGWMLTAPNDEDGWLRGNWECLAGLTVADIFTKYGSYYVGPAAYLRRNFVLPGASLVPYAQLGVGFILTDAFEADWQRAIGQAFEFQFHAQIGFRYLISQNWSLDIEGGYQHTSNAGMSSRNAGVNALGGQVGFTYHFPSVGK